MGIKLYCGLDETKWNENDLGNRFCISPIWGKSNRKNETRVKIDSLFSYESMEIIQDSGAFSDNISSRLSFSDALNRQINHANKYNYDKFITHRASYDLLIDEKWNFDGIRRKERWSEKEAEKAVNETILSAEFLNKNRNEKNLILSAQGVSTKQYVECAKQVLSFARTRDIFGLGGWCIVGIKRNNLRESFREIIRKVVPLVSKAKLHRIHIWGVMYAPALGELLWLCNKYKINLSTDSSSVHRKPYFNVWGYADWKNREYMRPQGNNEKLKQERSKHVRLSRKWLLNFERSKYYKSPFSKEKWK